MNGKTLIRNDAIASERKMKMTNEEREEIHNQYRWQIMYMKNTIKILRDSIRQYRMYWKIRHIERIERKQNELSCDNKKLQQKLNEIKKLCGTIMNCHCKDILADGAKLFANGPANVIINIIERT